MRSILKFNLMAFITIMIPVLVREIAFWLGLSGMSIIIIQIIIIMIFVRLFMYIFKLQDKYDDKTLEMIKNTKDIEGLKTLREERKTYRSKESITHKIIDKDFSDKEALNLKKYATTKEDMEHYYSSMISNADKEKREEYKTRRDNFNKRFKNKVIIYPDYNENLKTSIKWLIFFFIIAAIYNIFPRFIENKDIEALFMFVGLLFLFAVMINTIIWIIRTLKSYRIKDYI